MAIPPCVCEFNDSYCSQDEALIVTMKQIVGYFTNVKLMYFTNLFDLFQQMNFVGIIIRIQCWCNTPDITLKIHCSRGGTTRLLIQLVS